MLGIALFYFHLCPYLLVIRRENFITSKCQKYSTMIAAIIRTRALEPWFLYHHTSHWTFFLGYVPGDKCLKHNLNDRRWIKQHLYLESAKAAVNCSIHLLMCRKCAHFKKYHFIKISLLRKVKSFSVKPLRSRINLHSLKGKKLIKHKIYT